MTPIEALQQDPEAQLAERHRQESPWLDHEQLRPGDLVSFQRDLLPTVRPTKPPKPRLSCISSMSCPMGTE